MKSFLLLAFSAAAFAAPPSYKVVSKIKIGGAGRWDYVYVDSANHRLYVSHGTQTEVIDTATDKVVGTIPDTNGVHGIAVANDLGRGFTSDGMDNDVTIFDLKTLKVLGKVKTGTNPDAIIYEPVSHRVLTFNGRSNDSTVFDAKTGEVYAASIPVGGKPEFAQVDGKGHVYFNHRRQERDRRNRCEVGGADQALFDRALRWPERSRDQPEEQLSLFRLRKQDDDRQRSGGGQSDCDCRRSDRVRTAWRSTMATHSAPTAGMAVSRWSARHRPANSSPLPRS